MEGPGAIRDGTSLGWRDGGWSWPGGQARDLRLDLIRGFALAAMAINHFGFSQSYLHDLSGRSNFLINAAEVFFFISGMTLGVIAAREPVDRSVRRLLRRVVVVYLTVVGIGLFFAVVALSTDLMLWGDLPALGFAELGGWVNGVLTLQIAPFGADVLVAYVVYLAVAPVALLALAHGRGRLVVAVVAGAYLLSQIAPGLVELPVAAFRNLVANGPLFFGGLLVGWFRSDLGRWVAAGGEGRRRALRVGDAALVLAGIALAVGYARGFEGFGPLGELVGTDFVTREMAMPLPSLVVVALYLRVLWLLVDRLWVPLSRTTGGFLLPLGQASLFTYTAHLVVMPVFWNLPGFEEDVTRAAATVWVAAYLGVIYAAVRVRAAVRSVALAEPDRAQRLHRGPEAVVAILSVALFAFGWTYADDRAEWRLAEAEASVEYAQALAGELEEQDIEFELWEDVDGYVGIEIDEDDPRAIGAVESFEETWDAEPTDAAKG